MTDEQKEILIAKMLDAPSSLSDKELDAILHDDELRDLYEMSSAVSSAYAGQPELDMEDEWKCFRPRLRRKPTAMRWAMRVAAIFLGVVLASGIAVRIIDRIFTNDRQPVIAKVDQFQELKPDLSIQQRPQTSPTDEMPQIEKSKPAVPATRIAKAEVTPAKASLPHEESAIDIDEYLRIQQARIDNDLAIQAAESYMEEYDNLVPILDAAGVYDPEFDNAIRKVTME